MRNRAKCRLCGSIIESFHSTDFVTCKCDEIAVDGGMALRCSAKDWCNFLRVDDEGNEIVVNVQELTRYEKQEMIPYPNDNPRKDGDVKPLYKSRSDELLDQLDMMIKNIEELPQRAMMEPVNHYDLASSLMLLSALLRSLRNDDN
jgi:hypothetical protein